MNNIKPDTEHGLKAVIKREMKRLVKRPLYVFCMVIAPLFTTIFFTTLMSEGLPNKLPMGIVDLDHSSVSRSIIRNFDSFQQTDIVAYYDDFSAARKALQKSEIYGFFYIPRNLSKDAQSMKQPTLSFYTNDSYLIAASLLFKNMKTMGELASAGVNMKILLAKGVPNTQIKTSLKPIEVTAKPLNNPWINYSVYLSNTLVPGVLALMVLLVTVYSIGVEIKDGTSGEWLAKSNNSMWTAVLGKLIPQTIIWILMGCFILSYLYGIEGYPCNSGYFPMFVAIVALILSLQSFAIFIISMLPILRMALSISSLWGVLSFSITGFTFPVLAMSPVLQALAQLFPLRHYFVIYVNQALNGFPMIYAWTSYVALMIFMLLPFFTMKRLKYALLNFKHMP